MLEQFDVSFFISTVGVQDRMPQTAESCRKKAAACRRAARLARDPHARLQLLELAQAWLRLATRAEQLSPDLLVAVDEPRNGGVSGE